MRKLPLQGNTRSRWGELFPRLIRKYDFNPDECKLIINCVKCGKLANHVWIINMGWIFILIWYWKNHFRGRVGGGNAKKYIKKTRNNHNVVINLIKMSLVQVPSNFKISKHYIAFNMENRQNLYITNFLDLIEIYKLCYIRISPTSRFQGVMGL